MHRLIIRLIKNLSHTKTFYDDIYVFKKATDITERFEPLEMLTKFSNKTNHISSYQNLLSVKEKSIPYIGEFVDRNGVRIDPDKANSIREWTLPRTQGELLSFDHQKQS